MKKVISFMTVLLLCVSLACPVFAADTFVPSISYKDHPEIMWPAMLTDGDGLIEEINEGCLVITPVSEAETSNEIPDEAREELLEVYGKLSDGSMTLPFEGDTPMVIRDLFDLSLICTDGHKEQLGEEGVYLEVTLDIGVAAGVNVVVMAYVDGAWAPIHGVVNNGDGTVTCTFEEICPVAVCVPESTNTPPAQTGDNSGIAMWTVLLLVSAAALVVLLISRRKVAR